MREFHTASLADQVFERLESDIIHGVFARGEVLTELKLVDLLGVSRTPIREALRRLEQERLIEESGKGSVVLGITQEDVLDIMDIRQRIEGLASFYATKNANEESIKELAHIMDLQDFYYEKRDYEHLRQMDDSFHDKICAMSKRTVISDTLLPLHRKTRRYRKASMENDARLVKMVEEHRAIYEAVISGDAEKAEMLTAQHIANAKKNMLGRMKNNG